MSLFSRPRLIYHHARINVGGFLHIRTKLPVRIFVLVKCLIRFVVIGTRTLSIFFGFQICHPSTHREVGSPECGFLVIIARSRDVHISGSKSFAVCIAKNSLRLVFVAHVEIFGLLLARSRQVSVCGVSQFLFSADLHIVVFDLGVVDVVLSRCRRIVLDFFIEEFASRQDRYA